MLIVENIFFKKYKKYLYINSLKKNTDDLFTNDDDDDNKRRGMKDLFYLFQLQKSFYFLFICITSNYVRSNHFIIL